MKFKNGNGLLKWIIEIMFRGFGNEWNESVDKSEREYDTNGKKIYFLFHSLHLVPEHTYTCRQKDVACLFSFFNYYIGNIPDVGY